MVGAGAPVSGSDPLAVFGKAITSRMLDSPAKKGDEPLDAEREASVRRSAHSERVEEPAELRSRLLVGHPHRAEDALLDLLAMDPDRARAELPAVPDQVVVLAEGSTRIGLDQILVAFDRAGERVVHEGPLLRVLVLQEQREVENPEERVARLVEKLELMAELEPKGAEDTLHHRRAVGGKEDRRSG